MNKKKNICLIILLLGFLVGFLYLTWKGFFQGGVSDFEIYILLAFVMGTVFAYFAGIYQGKGEPISFESLEHGTEFFVLKKLEYASYFNRYLCEFQSGKTFILKIGPSGVIDNKRFFALREGKLYKKVGRLEDLKNSEIQFNYFLETVST